MSLARDGMLKVARSVGIVIRLESWKPIQEDKEEVKVKPGNLSFLVISTSRWRLVIVDIFPKLRV